MRALFGHDFRARFEGSVCRLLAWLLGVTVLCCVLIFGGAPWLWQGAWVSLSDVGTSDDPMVCNLDQFVSTLVGVAVAGGLSAGYSKTGELYFSSILALF